MRRPALLVAGMLIAAALLACESQPAPSSTPTTTPDAPTTTTTPHPTSTVTPAATTAPPTPASTVAASPVTPSATVAATAVTVTPDATAAATAVTVTPEPTPGSTPPPTPTVTVERLANVTLKYALLGRFGDLWYCDPDYWPIARADEGDLARQHLPGIRQDADTFAAILAHLGYPDASTYTSDQTLAIYREWKMLRALQLEPVGSVFRFDARFTRDGGQTGVLAQGTIDASGRITVTSQAPSDPPICPICLARGTVIATPSGPMRVEDLREGMAVWTQAPDGSPMIGLALAVGSTRAPAEHEVVRLALDDGRVLHASPGHPLADGRRLADLEPGDHVDGARVVDARRIAYGSGETFDLLPSGPTGTYWADGVLLASTLIGVVPVASSASSSPDSP